MPGMQAMAKRMGHNVVGHHPIMPGGSKAAQAFAATRCLEDGVCMYPMMTILSFLCKTLPQRIQSSREIRCGAQL